MKTCKTKDIYTHIYLTGCFNLERKKIEWQQIERGCLPNVQIPVTEEEAAEERKRRAGTKKCAKCQFGLQILAAKEYEKDSYEASEE